MKEIYSNFRIFSHVENVNVLYKSKCNFRKDLTPLLKCLIFCKGQSISNSFAKNVSNKSININVDIDIFLLNNDPVFCTPYFGLLSFRISYPLDSSAKLSWNLYEPIFIFLTSFVRERYGQSKIDWPLLSCDFFWLSDFIFLTIFLWIQALFWMLTFTVMWFC